MRGAMSLAAFLARPSVYLMANFQSSTATVSTVETVHIPFLAGVSCFRSEQSFSTSVGEKYRGGGGHNVEGESHSSSMLYKQIHSENRNGRLW